jgi:hypothetical protein
VVEKVMVVVLAEGARHDGVDYPVGASIEIEKDLLPTWSAKGLCRLHVPEDDAPKPRRGRKGKGEEDPDGGDE